MLLEETREERGDDSCLRNIPDGWNQQKAQLSGH